MLELAELKPIYPSLLSGEFLSAPRLQRGAGVKSIVSTKADFGK
ncbi:hypothetical protein [Draconibacterium sediminis]|nr:hypothetical protein [Draconibacterium sediminis]